MPPSTPSPHDPRRPAAKDVLPTARRLPAHPPRPPRRPPAEDPGFEVIDDPADPGFEVIDDTTPSRSVKGKTAPDPGFEVIEDEAPRRRPKKAVEADDDGDDAPPRSKRRRRDEDDEDDRPRKKKGKRKRGGIAVSEEDADRERENENKIVEWGVPISLAIFGLGMAVFGAMKGLGAVGPLFAIMITVGTSIVLVPITIAALMVIGMLVGIEYGTLGSAIRNLTAITMMVQGVLWLGMGLDLCMLTWLVTPVVTLAMFMTLFRLDMWEAWITVTLLDVIQMGFSMLIFGVIFIALAKGIDSKMSDPDPDDGPFPGMNEPDDGGGKGDWNKRNKGKRPPRDPDDDGF